MRKERRKKIRKSRGEKRKPCYWMTIEEKATEIADLYTFLLLGISILKNRSEFISNIAQSERGATKIIFLNFAFVASLLFCVLSGLFKRVMEKQNA